MKHRHFSLLTILLFFFLTAQSQINIAGKVTDENKKPLFSATVSLLNTVDSSVLKTALTNAEGIFEIKNIIQKQFLISVSMIGYKKHFTPIVNNAEQTHMLPTIELIRTNEQLAEVNLTYKKPLIEQKIDRTIVNVDAILSNAGVNALEVLENAPGVSVDQNGTISLQGKTAVVIFIDDKPTYMSTSDLANYLRSLPSGSLDKIEIMTNPPAKYDAAGNAGVINIKTKKNKAAGFNGAVNLNFNQGRYSRTNNSLNFNYRNGKINFFGTASYSLNNSFNDLDIHRYYFNGNGSLRSTFFQNSFIRRTTNSYSSKLGLDYFLSPNTTVGILLNGSTRPSLITTLNNSIVRNSTGAVDSIITADNIENNRWRNGSINLNLNHKYNTTGREISFDLDYVTYHSTQEQHFLNGIFASNGNLKSEDGLTGDLPSAIQIYSAKTDYSHPLKRDAKMEAGAKTSIVSTDNAANYFNVINNTSTHDFDKTNHFLYKETISAAYVNLNKQWKQWSVQGGLRFENTISDGHQVGNSAKPDSSFRRGYNNLFPTFYVLHKLDTNSRNQLRLSYGRRIDRPIYQDLNPFISPLDKFSIYVGNPYLRPTITNSFEFSHIFKNKITTTISYSFTDDIIQETIDLSNSIYISRPANIGKSSVLGLSVSASFSVAKWWTFNFSGELQNRHYEGLLYDYNLDTSAVYYGINLNNQYILGKGWTAEVSGFYRSGILVGQIISGETGQLNAGIAKKILNNKGSIKLNARDILYTRLNHGIITSIKNAYATYHNWGDSRNITLSFTYNFGKLAGSQRTRSSATETEQNRVRN